MRAMQPLKQGYLLKKGGSKGGRRNWSNRFFVLSADSLRYYSEKGGTLKGEIALTEFVSATCFRLKNHPYCINLNTGSRTFLIDISEENRRVEWLTAIRGIGGLWKYLSTPKVTGNTLGEKIITLGKVLLDNILEVLDIARDIDKQYEKDWRLEGFSDCVDNMVDNLFLFLVVSIDTKEKNYDTASWGKFISSIDSFLRNMDLLVEKIDISLSPLNINEHYPNLKVTLKNMYRLFNSIHDKDTTDNNDMTNVTFEMNLGEISYRNRADSLQVATELSLFKKLHMEYELDISSQFAKYTDVIPQINVSTLEKDQVNFFAINRVMPSRRFFSAGASLTPKQKRVSIGVNRISC
eukprot:TRINITY_DN7277_c0_g1_i1.p1 TRINITY_DN7277_c0_g1~~TRINITY_DN7277_c0_g1_i1.p1  ORF type:complete len:351 (+),score=58.96 TRINITY_DN7277_c0_g1_i1:8-1060(+)